MSTAPTPLKSIVVFKNGNPNSAVDCAISSTTWNGLLQDLTRMLNPSFGPVRNLYLAETGVRIRNLSQLKDKERYVATGADKLKGTPIGYRLREDSYSSSVAQKGRTVIHLFKNGLTDRPAWKFVLTPNDYVNWSKTTQFIGLHMNVLYGDVNQFYNLSGKRVQPHEFEDGCYYVAVGYHDSFKPRQYMQYYETECVGPASSAASSAAAAAALTRRGSGSQHSSIASALSAKGGKKQLKKGSDVSSSPTKIPAVADSKQQKSAPTVKPILSKKNSKKIPSATSNRLKIEEVVKYDLVAAETVAETGDKTATDNVADDNKGLQDATRSAAKLKKAVKLESPDVGVRFEVIASNAPPKRGSKSDSEIYETKDVRKGGQKGDRGAVDDKGGGKDEDEEQDFIPFEEHPYGTQSERALQGLLDYKSENAIVTKPEIAQNTPKTGAESLTMPVLQQDLKRLERAAQEREQLQLKEEQLRREQLREEQLRDEMLVQKELERKEQLLQREQEEKREREKKEQEKEEELNKKLYPLGQPLRSHLTGNLPEIIYEQKSDMPPTSGRAPVEIRPVVVPDFQRPIESYPATVFQDERTVARRPLGKITTPRDGTEPTTPAEEKPEALHRGQHKIGGRHELNIRELSQVLTDLTRNFDEAINKCHHSMGRKEEVIYKTDIESEENQSPPIRSEVPSEREDLIVKIDAAQRRNNSVHRFGLGKTATAEKITIDMPKPLHADVMERAVIEVTSQEYAEAVLHIQNAHSLHLIDIKKNAPYEEQVVNIKDQTAELINRIETEMNVLAPKEIPGQVTKYIVTKDDIAKIDEIKSKLERYKALLEKTIVTSGIRSEKDLREEDARRKEQRDKEQQARQEQEQQQQQHEQLHQKGSLTMADLWQGKSGQPAVGLVIEKKFTKEFYRGGEQRLLLQQRRSSGSSTDGSDGSDVETPAAVAGGAEQVPPLPSSRRLRDAAAQYTAFLSDASTQSKLHRAQGLPALIAPGSPDTGTSNSPEKWSNKSPDPNETDESMSTQTRETNAANTTKIIQKIDSKYRAYCRARVHAKMAGKMIQRIQNTL